MSTKSPYELKPNHADFKKVEASRPDFSHKLPITYTKSPNPNWKYGDGAVNSLQDRQQTPLDPGHMEIDPHHVDRSIINNYKLLVSAIPRPISFISTISTDGTHNLAPFSYFQVVDHNPPIFVVGFTGRLERPKDTQKNLIETGECVINIISEHFIEAANATSLDVAKGISEWELSGLRQAPSTAVRPARVKEAIFSIEGKLLEMKSLDYHGYGKHDKPFGSLAIIEGLRFWVREDAINGTLDEIDLAVMRPLVQLGGIQYGRIRETFELPRPSLATELTRKDSTLHDFMKQ